jgi:beta-lactamase class A
MRVVRYLALLIALVPTPAVANGLADVIQRHIAASGAEVAVALRTLDGATDLFIQPDTSFHAASTMKVPVMIELFRQAAAGQLALDEPLPVRNEFHSIVDRSLYKLSEGDDSDAAIYTHVGGTMTPRQLCEAMITVSSNLATNILIEKLGVENIRRTVTEAGAEGMQLLRGVEDGKAFEKGLNNATTARGLLILLERIAAGTAVSPEASRAMVDILSRQRFNSGIPAGVPPGTIVAHKTGNITKIHHDAGIVYGPRPFVIVVLVRGIAEEQTSAALIAAITREVFDRIR